LEHFAAEKRLFRALAHVFGAIGTAPLLEKKGVFATKKDGGPHLTRSLPQAGESG